LLKLERRDDEILLAMPSAHDVLTQQLVGDSSRLTASRCDFALFAVTPRPHWNKTFVDERDTVRLLDAHQASHLHKGYAPLKNPTSNCALLDSQELRSLGSGQQLLFCRLQSFLLYCQQFYLDKRC